MTDVVKKSKICVVAEDEQTKILFDGFNEMLRGMDGIDIEFSVFDPQHYDYDIDVNVIIIECISDTTTGAFERYSSKIGIGWIKCIHSDQEIDNKITHHHLNGTLHDNRILKFNANDSNDYSSLRGTILQYIRQHNVFSIRERIVKKGKLDIAKIRRSISDMTKEIRRLTHAVKRQNSELDIKTTEVTELEHMISMDYRKTRLEELLSSLSDEDCMQLLDRYIS